MTWALDAGVQETWTFWMHGNMHALSPFLSPGMDALATACACSMDDHGRSYRPGMDALATNIKLVAPCPLSTPSTALAQSRLAARAVKTSSSLRFKRRI